MPPGQPEAPIVAVASLDPEPQPRGAAVRIGWLVAALLLVNLAASLYQLPLNRVVESRLCREYYGEHDPSAIGPDGNVDEELCKVDAVQQGLAWIQGVMDTEWIVGDFVMTIPLGFVAERYGRRTVLWLNLVPRLFMLAWAVGVGYCDGWLPTNAIVAGPALSFLGGDCVFNSLTYALAASMTEDPVIRASYFAYLSSVTYVVALMGPALASATMSLLLWLPFFLGIALLLLAIPAIAALPPHEPLPPRRTMRPDDHHAGSDDVEQPLLASFPVPMDIDPKPNVLRGASSSFRNLRATISSHPRNFSLLLVSFVLTSLASSDTKLLVQYISKRYKWKFAAAGYLLSGKAVVNFVLLTIVVPSLLRWRDHRLDTADRDNMQYAKGCLVISVVGALGIALSVNVWLLVPMLLVYAVGSALPIFTLSLLKSPSICPSQEERDGGGKLDAQTHIFSIVMMVKTLGSLLGAPIMAALWVAGIGIGALGLGLPYIFSAACYLLALLVFSYIILG